MAPRAVRVQRKRVAGWRMPPNTVYVGRGSKWGNPHRVGTGPGEVSREKAVRLYRKFMRGREEEVRRELEGKNLACWCSLEMLCHADVLLAVARGKRF